jgi:hypothetical protein
LTGHPRKEAGVASKACVRLRQNANRVMTRPRAQEYAKGREDYRGKEERGDGQASAEFRIDSGGLAANRPPRVQILSANPWANM